MARGSNLQLGSCTTFPIEGSHSDALRFGCFTSTQYTCNQFNNVLQMNHVGFEARFNPNLACNPDVQVLDSSGVLNENMRILSEYTNEDHLSQRFGTARPSELYVKNDCPSGTIQVEECCNGDCTKPIGLCLKNDKLDVKTLCNNAYESAIRKDGSKRRSGSSVLKSYNSSNDRRIDTTLVPQSKSILSGVGCRDGACIKIPDLYKHLQTNRNVDYTFYPYDVQIFNKLTLGNINLPENQTPREHFVKMYTEGGHGINRPMNIDEMFNAHSNSTNTNLTRNDISLMISSYEVETTFRNNEFGTENCICDIARSIETEEIFVSFPKVASPTNENSLNITIAKGTADFVARKLGGIRIPAGSLKKVIKQDPDKILNRVVSSRELQTTSNITGLCLLSDGTSINTDVLLCDSLGGSFTQNPSDDQEFSRDYKTVKKTNKSLSYECQSLDNYVNESFVFSRDTYLPPDIPERGGWPVVLDNHRGPPDIRELRQINSCCNEFCLECLFNAMREVEVGTWDDDDGPGTPDSYGCGRDENGNINCETRPSVTPKSLPDPCDCPDSWFDDDGEFNDLSCCGCNVESYVDCVDTPVPQRDTTNCPSCGQHQIKKRFFDDGGQQCAKVPACCVLEDADWREELCEPCLKLEKLPCASLCLKCPDDDGDPFEDQDCEVLGDPTLIFPDDPTNLGNRKPYLSCESCAAMGGRCECYTQEEVNQSVIDCCKRKKELGELAKRCWNRRYTRNGPCQKGTGEGFENGDNPDCKYLNPSGSCFSCLDIAAMHNGGSCGHRSTNPITVARVNIYKNRIKQVLCDIGGGCENCIEIRVENCTPLYPNPEDPTLPLDPQPPLTPLGGVRPDFWPPEYPKEFKKPRYLTPPRFIPFGDDDACPEEVPPIDDEVRADASDNWSNLPGAIPQSPASEGINSPEFRSDGPYAVYGTGRAGGQGFYYPMYLTAIAAYAANLTGFDRVESKTGKKDGLLYHTHRLSEYPDVIFYMPDDQMNHGVSDDGGFKRYRGVGPSSSARSTQTSTSQQSQTSYTSSPSTPSAPPPSGGGGGGGYGGGY